MSLHHPIGEIHPVDAARFWLWVEKSPECWEWQGTVHSTSGYGNRYINGRTHGAHRIAWAITNGEIPEGMVIDHMCHNLVCVNPDHLRLATHKQNLEHIKPVRAKSGYRGVIPYRKDQWRGCVRHNGKLHHTIPFSTAEEANTAVIELRNELYTHNLLDRQAV